MADCSSRGLSRAAGLCLPLLVSCVSAPALESTMTSYQGSEEREIRRVFGEPDHEYVDDEGFRVLVFGQRGVFVHPDCVANFLINSDNRVARWTWSGRHCQAFVEQNEDFSEARHSPEDAAAKK